MLQATWRTSGLIFPKKQTNKQTINSKCKQFAKQPFIKLTSLQSLLCRKCTKSCTIKDNYRVSFVRVNATVQPRTHFAGSGKNKLSGFQRRVAKRPLIPNVCVSPSRTKLASVHDAIFLACDHFLSWRKQKLTSSQWLPLDGLIVFLEHTSARSRI